MCSMPAGVPGTGAQYVKESGGREEKRGPPLVGLGDLPKAILAIVVKQMPVGITVLMKKGEKKRMGCTLG